MRKFIQILLFAFAGMVVYGQDSDPVTVFSGNQNQEAIHLSFILTGGFTCNGITIQRLHENGSGFTTVGHIAGICGSTSAPVGYKFTDSSPLANKTNTYRLLLGGVIPSDLLEIEYIRYNSEGVFFHHDKSSGKVNVRINENQARNDEKTMAVYRLDGQVMKSETNQGSQFTVNTNGWSPGIYIFHLRNPYEVLLHRKVFVSR